MEALQSNLRIFLFICINGACLGFVIWQTMNCIKTYIEMPIGTRLKMDKSTALPFPAITVCGTNIMIRYDDKFNKFEELIYYDTNYLKDTCKIR